ncbi:MAG: NAD(P)-binding domain-containing protein [Alphaproteobacteria bacterium]|nr:NAD(P)-binding domain-containing protein [Alphaproteobacteria bacterium]
MSPASPSLPQRHAVFGTGMVGQAIAGRLAAQGLAVFMGSRTDDNERGRAFAAAHGERACHGSFAQGAEHADVVWLAVNGQHAEAVVAQAGPERLAGKVLVDLTNPLDFSQGMPPHLFTGPRESLAERIQAAAPGARVVKTLNTMNCQVMVDPGRLSAPTDVFLSGDDADAKATVAAILKSWGWQAPLDLGGLATARGPEAWVPFWVMLYGAQGTPDFNLKLVRS